MELIRKQVSKGISFVKGLPRTHSIGGGITLIALALVGGHLLGRAAPDNLLSAVTTSQVRVASVASLSTSEGSLPVTGKVASLAQATILAQTSGEIVTLSRSLGDYVSAGTVIASFENSGQKAAVLQAQGAVDAAQAALAKSIGSTAQNLQTTSLTSLQDAYAALDDAIHVRTDQLFTNARSASPDLTIVVPNSVLVMTIESERAALEANLSDARLLTLGASPENVTANSLTMSGYLQKARIFLDNLIQATNEALPSQGTSIATLAAYQTSLAAARAEVTSAMSSVTGAKSGYDNNDLAAVQANVKQAQGALAAAQSGLEKTVVRSPISGNIVSLPITQGSYVSAFTQIAVVSNPNALYIDARVTSDDAKTLSVGNKALIDGAARGVITFIAPAIDPTTGKIEVKIGIEGGYGPLTDGSVVNVALGRTAASDQVQTAALTIPIVSVKITPNGPVVFSVSEANALLAHAIGLGSILGDRVVVQSGLTGDMRIVTDARGLSEGQLVTPE